MVYYMLSYRGSLYERRENICQKLDEIVKTVNLGQERLKIRMGGIDTNTRMQMEIVSLFTVGD